jgi:YegS/Rv2252/BmrU family lipid kinase
MLKGIRSASIIFNPLAGRGHSRRPQELAEAQRILIDAGIETDLRPTGAAGEAGAIAARAVAQGRELIVVCGGDGTLHEVVNGMAGSQVPVALLPAGTANVLAKELEIPWNIPKAAALIPTGIPVRVALGLMTPVNDPRAARYFVIVAGVGLDAAMIHSLNPKLKQRTGTAAYWMEGFSHLFKNTFPKFRLTSGKTIHDASLVVIGRSRHYGGPLEITTGADFFADEFELAVFTTRSKMRYVFFLPAIWLGYLRKMRGVHFLKTRSFRCDLIGAGEIHTHLDGEPAAMLPVEFTILPDALTIIVPRKILSRLPARAVVE